MSSGNFDKDSLQIYFNRIVALEREKKAEAANFNEDIKCVYGEARDAGFSPKILRAIVAEQLGPKKAQEDLDLEAIYRDALGLTPLEQAAAKREDEKRDEKREAEQAAAEHLEQADGAAAAPDAEPLPESSAEKAQAIVDKIGRKRVALVPAAGGFRIDRAAEARGSMGKLLDTVHDALIEAGFTHHSGGVYRAPAQEAAEA